MALGVGYAIWIDELTVNTNIVTGDLRLDFEDAVRDISSYGTLYEDMVTTNTKYLDQNQIKFLNGIEGGLDSDDKSELTIYVNGLYPGAQVYHTVDIVNNGTIPAIIQDVKFDNGVIGDIGDYFYTDFGIISEDDNGTIIHYVAFSKATINELEESLNDVSMSNSYNTTLKSKPIYPGERVTMALGLILFDSITNDQIAGGSDIKFTITFSGEQYN